MRYKREHGVRETRVFGDNALTNRDYSTDITSPSFDLTIQNVERSRLFRVFRGRVERASLSFGFARGIGERYRTEERPGRPIIEGSGRTDTDRMTFTGNWTGQWRRGDVDVARRQPNQQHQRESRGCEPQGVKRSMQAQRALQGEPEGRHPTAVPGPTRAI